jgi:hypothetical protein
MPTTTVTAVIAAIEASATMGAGTCSHASKYQPCKQANEYLFHADLPVGKELSPFLHNGQGLLRVDSANEILLGRSLRSLFSPTGIRTVFNGFPIFCPGFSPRHFFFADNTDLTGQKTFISLE